MDHDTASLVWVVDALGQAYTQGQIKLVDYLEPIADDAVFEVEMAANRAWLLSKMTSTGPVDISSASPSYLRSIR